VFAEDVRRFEPARFGQQDHESEYRGLMA
jgi:hypothetical protein